MYLSNGFLKGGVIWEAIEKVVKSKQFPKEFVLEIAQDGAPDCNKISQKFRRTDGRTRFNFIQKVILNRSV